MIIFVRCLFAAAFLACLSGVCFGAEASNAAAPGNNLVWDNAPVAPTAVPIAPAAAPDPAAVPVAPPTTPATPFEQALIYVYQQHPQLASEREQLKILDERVSQAASGFRPTLSATAGTGEQRESIDNQAWRYGDATQGTLTAIQPLFSFGSLAQWKAAKARVESGRDQLLATEQTVLLTAITAWLELCEKERIVAITHDHLQRIRLYQAATEARMKAGEATSTDLAQAESRMAEAEARIAIAEADAETARAVYRRDIGRDPPEPMIFPPLPLDLPRSLEETMELAKRNPELDAAAYAEAAADHDIDTAESGIYPSLYLRGSMDDQRSPSLGLQRQRDDSITINISMPLYQGGAEYSKIREAKIAKAKAQQDGLTVQRNVTARAEQAWSGYQAAGRVAEASAKASDAAAHMLAGLEEEQRQGARSLTDVLDAKAELLGTQISEAQARKNQRLEAYRLLAATGQLTVAHLRLDVPAYDPQTHYDDTAGRWFGFD